MKFFIVAIILISNFHAINLNWLHDYDVALEQAKKEKKDVYLFIGADVCRWCDRFYKTTLSKKEVIKKLEENYVLLYMSRDQHKIPDKFEKYGVPRHYFLTENGEIIFKTQGSREVDGFYSLLEEVDLSKED